MLKILSTSNCERKENAREMNSKSNRRRHPCAPSLEDSSTTMSTHISATCLINAVLLVIVIVVAVSKSDLTFSGVGGAITSESISSEDKDAPIEQLGKAPTSKYHIFVASKPDSGSTLLANMLLGLFDDADANQNFMHYNFAIVEPEGANIDDTTVTKTHINDLDVIYTHFRDDYDQIFFVVTNRGQARLEERYCGPDYSHMILCLEYDEFIYADESKMKDSISFVAKRIHDQFPYFENAELDEDNCAKRLKEMGEEMEAMKDMSFTQANRKFGVHGGHAGRKKDGQ